MILTKTWRDPNTVFYGYQNKVTDEQATYLDSMEKNRLTISNSVSGSGKTTLAVAFAHYHQKNLLYLFAPVQEGQMGYRPGGQQAKESIYYGPLQDALLEIGENPRRAIKVIDEEDDFFAHFVSREDIIDRKLNPNKKRKVWSDEDWVEAKSHIFIRGTNIGKDGETVIVIDEAQNWTKPQLKKALTRIHDNAKVIVIGHTGQIDLPDPSQSGFEDLIYHFHNKPYAQICNLTINFRGELSRDADNM